MKTLLLTSTLCILLSAGAGFANGIQNITGGTTLTLALRPQTIFSANFSDGITGWAFTNFQDHLSFSEQIPAHNGKKCFAITRVGAKADTAWELISRPVAVPEKRPYTFSYWLRANQTMAHASGYKELFHSEIRWKNARGTVISVTPISLGNATPEWVNSTLQGNTPAGTTQAEIHFGFNNPIIEPNHYFALDDISFSIMPDPPVYLSEGEFISSPIRIPPQATFAFHATIPDATSVQVQLRTAPDDGLGTPGNWTAWSGPDGTSGSFYSASGGALSALHATHPWAQYHVLLRSRDPRVTPTLHAIRFGGHQRDMTEVNRFEHDRQPPTLLRNSPGWMDNALAPITFTLQDGNGTGVDPATVRMTLDSREVSNIVQRAPAGRYSYQPPTPLTPDMALDDFTMWTISKYNIQQTFTPDAPRLPGGAASLRIRGPQQPGNTSFNIISPLLAVKGGASYRLSIWLQTTLDLSHVGDKGASCVSTLTWLNAYRQPVGASVPVNLGTPNTAWHQVAITADAPAEACVAQLQLGWISPVITGANMVAFADIALDGPHPDARLAPNLHRITVNASDYAGNAMDEEFWLYITHAKLHKVVTTRDDGVTLVEGHPFFPIGLFDVKSVPTPLDYDAVFPELHAAGFNLVHTYDADRTPNLEHFLAAAARNDLHVFIAGHTRANNKEPRDMVVDVATGEELPQLLAWYLADDAAFNIAPSDLARVRHAVHEIDPSHLTMQADSVNLEKNSYAPFVNCTDGFIPEIYPIRERKPTELPHATAVMKNIFAAFQHAGVQRKPLWACLQDYHGWGQPRFPAYDELHALAFLTIIHGANGILFYSYYRSAGANGGAASDPVAWENTKRVAHELAQFADVFTEPDGPRTPVARILAGPAKDGLGYSSINLLLKRHGDDYYLFAMNSSYEPLKVQFDVNSAVIVVNENRQFAPANSFTDDFAPLGVHVYRWKG